MASFARFDSRPLLKDPILIAGLPGVGDIGKIAVDLIADQLHAERLVRIFSDDLPATVYVDEDCCIEAPCFSLWLARLKDADVVFLRGNCQATSIQGQISLAKKAFELVLEHDPSLVISLGGSCIEDSEKSPRLLGAVTEPGMKQLFELYGIDLVPEEPMMGIGGVAGALMALCDAYGVDGLCIVAETSGMFEDNMGAKAIVDALSSLLGVEIDTSCLSEDTNEPPEDEPFQEQDPPYFG